MVEFSEELLRTGSNRVEYQKILENLCDISKAKYGALTLYEPKTAKYTTAAVVGINDIVEKASRLLGYEIIGKEWPKYGTKNEEFESNVVSYFSSLQQLAEGVIPTVMIKSLEKIFDIGEIAVTKIMKDNQMVGDFTLLMPRGTQLENQHLVEIYSRQIDMFFSRIFTEEALKSSEEKYRLITEFASDVIWTFNITKNQFTYISPSILQLRGLTAEEAMKQSLEEALTAESLDFINSNMATHINDFIKSPKALINPIAEVQQPCKNGDIIWIEISTKCRYNSDCDIEVVGISRSIDERKKSEKQVIYLSYHDQLTKLYNRRFYEEELRRLDTERNLPITLVMADVNGLKLTNDAFGHKAGDMLLEKIANILKRECRADEIVARIGGDEFVILLQKTGAQNASKIIERINKAITKEKIANVILSISMGFAVKQDISEDMNEVFKKAEDDMYRHKLSESSSIRSQTIDLIMNSLYEKNNREMLHSKRVSEICEAIARSMNFDKDDINQIRIAGLMHDIGKIGINDNILNKVDKLNSDEWHDVMKHSEIGYRILSSVNEFSKIAEYVLEHHERWNGKGYPKGLQGEEISIEARIITVADAYDAMTSDRAYRNALEEEQVIKEIKSNAGIQFDPNIVVVFIEKVLGKVW